MKKVSFLMTIVVAACLISCTGRPKANLKTEIDTLSYATGIVRADGLIPHLIQSGVDTAYFSHFMKGFYEGTSNYDKKDIAYTTGVQIGQIVSKNWVDGINQRTFGDDSIQTISRDNLIAGFVDALTRGSSSMDKLQAQSLVNEITENIQNRMLEEKYGTNRRAGEEFLAANKQKEGIITTPSGLQYKIITQGKGATPTKDTKTVEVRYIGKLIDGTEFDNSNKRNKDKPSKQYMSNVIPGWKEVLQLMPAGSRWEVYVPQELAYGSQERSNGVIKPFSTLVFDIELVSFE